MVNTIKTELIEKFMMENKLSRTAFCKRCKIGADTLNKILNNAVNFRITALFKTARVLNIEVNKLFNN